MKATSPQVWGNICFRNPLNELNDENFNEESGLNILIESVLNLWCDLGNMGLSLVLFLGNLKVWLNEITELLKIQKQVNYFKVEISGLFFPLKSFLCSMK